MSNNEILALRESIATLESQLREASSRAQRLADARGNCGPSDELADAVEQEHEMRRAAETDPARLMDLAAASYRLSAALANYRKAQKARS